MDFYSASSLKQQPADRHVAPIGHIILIPSQQVFALSPLNTACLEEKQQIPIVWFALIGARIHNLPYHILHYKLISFLVHFS
jgi:hypothetical protein